jgi:hypothetical protein
VQVAIQQTFLRITTRRVFKLRCILGFWIIKVGLWVAGAQAESAQ